MPRRDRSSTHAPPTVARQEPSVPDLDVASASRLRTRADLASENARLRAALAEHGIPLERPRVPSQDAPRRPDAAAAQDLVSQDLISQDLVAELLASRVALSKSEERLAFAFAASGTFGWWDWDIASDRIYAGEQLARMYGVDPALAAAGAPIATFLDGIHTDDKAWVGARIAGAMAEGGDFSAEYRLQAPDGTLTWIHARGRCYHDAQGRPARFPGVALDITERRAAETRKDALVQLGDSLRDIEDIGQIAYTAAEIIAQAIGATRAGYGTVDPAGETVLMHPDWCRAGTASTAGLHQFRDYGSFIDDLKRGEVVIIADVTADARTSALAQALLALGIRVLANVPIVVRGRLAAVMFIHHDQAHAWTPQEIAFIRTVADRTQAAIARVQAEEQQAVLNIELSHRLKNTLALVQSIAVQTLRNTSDVDAAREALSQRLVALGKAHDILLAAGHESAEVSEVVRGALSPHADAAERFRFEGPAFRIGPSPALSLTLTLHELATNAAKYGALVNPDGRIAVTWALEHAEGEAVFRLDWTESGGPPVTLPSRKGFGTRLIERGLSGGSATSDYRPEGLACTLTAPLAGLRAEG